MVVVVVAVVVDVVVVVVVLTSVSMRKCLAAVEKVRTRAKNFNILLDSLSGLGATELGLICHLF